MNQSLIPKFVSSDNDVTRQCQTYINGVYYSTSTFLHKKKESYMRGYNVPNFHTRLKRGELLPTTPFEQYICYGESTGFNACTVNGTVYTCVDADSWSAGDDRWVIEPSDFAEYVPSLPDRFVGEAAGKIYGEGYDALTAAAELAQTARMFQNVARGFLRMDEILASIKGFSLKRDYKSLTGAWLSVRYGWRTLIYDIQSLSDQIAKLDERRLRYKKSAGDFYTTSASDETTQILSRGTRVHLTTDVVRVELRGSVTADVVIPKFQINPLQTGWELIPFSFVIDWFVNVGKTLGAWAFLSRYPDYVASYGYEILIERSYANTIDPWIANASGNNKQEATCKATLQIRKPCRVPIAPQFVVRLNAYKILDLIALVLQRT